MLFKRCTVHVMWQSGEHCSEENICSVFMYLNTVNVLRLPYSLPVNNGKNRNNVIKRKLILKSLYCSFYRFLTFFLPPLLPVLLYLCPPSSPSVELSSLSLCMTNSKQGEPCFYVIGRTENSRLVILLLLIALYFHQFISSSSSFPNNFNSHHHLCHIMCILAF